MKRVMLCGLTMVLMASVAVSAESRAARSTVRVASAQASVAPAADLPMPPPLSPVPDPLYSPSIQQTSAQYTTTPAPMVPTPTPSYSIQGQPYPTFSQPLELFPDVRYHAARNIAPCAVPTIIQVPDPCNKDSCCKTCVNVQICVPPCDPACVKVTRDGRTVCYDFGKYSVVAKTVGNHVVVRYHD